MDGLLAMVIVGGRSIHENGSLILLDDVMAMSCFNTVLFYELK